MTLHTTERPESWFTSPGKTGDVKKISSLQWMQLTHWFELHNNIHLMKRLISFFDHLCILAMFVLMVQSARILKYFL